MIFVHSRKETSRTAEAMRDLTSKEGTGSLLDNLQHEKYGVWKRDVDRSRSVELQQLFYQVDVDVTSVVTESFVLYVMYT